MVTCLGILVADVVGKPIDKIPERGTLMAVDRMELHPGGCAANTGITLAKLGVQASVIGKVGLDGFGDFMVNAFAPHGIDARGVVRATDGSATSATMVLVSSDGERTFLHYPGANTTFSSDDVNWDIVQESPILHIAGPYLLPNYVGEQNAEVLKRAKSLGITTTLDTVWDFTGRWMEVLKPCLPFLDYALPSLEEAKKITGYDNPHDIAGVLLDLGVKVVGIKLGGDGSYARTMDGYEILVPPLKVNAIDSLGAGDAWSAGFLTGLVKEWDLEKSLTFANAVGACCVQALGTTTGIRSFDETYMMAFGG